MKDQILVLSNAGDDVHTELVMEHLERMGERCFRFNTETFPEFLNLSVEARDGDILGQLVGVDQKAPIDLSRVKSVWYRRPVAPQPKENMHKGYWEFAQEESKGALWSFYTALDTFWLNSPITLKLLEQNKLYQIREAMRVGLSVPKTVVTNDPSVLYEFAERNGGTIALKTLHGSFFTREDSPATELIFTTPITTATIRERWTDISLAPVLAQAYIEKKMEFRVTMVGEKIFSCAIHSQESEFTKHDWRNYDFNRVKHEPYALPEDVNRKLLLLMKRLGLVYGGIDMILTPSGEYVFLEVNPSGQWHWIEKLTGMPISQAIADLLANPPTA